MVIQWFLATLFIHYSFNVWWFHQVYGFDFWLEKWSFRRCEFRLFSGICPIGLQFICIDYAYATCFAVCNELGYAYWVLGHKFRMEYLLHLILMKGCSPGMVLLLSAVKLVFWQRFDSFLSWFSFWATSVIMGKWIEGSTWLYGLWSLKLPNRRSTFWSIHVNVFSFRGKFSKRLRLLIFIYDISHCLNFLNL